MIWEKTIELLRRHGWEVACAKCIDLETQEGVFLVSVNLGEKKLTSLFPTLDEAATILSRVLAPTAA